MLLARLKGYFASNFDFWYHVINSGNNHAFTFKTIVLIVKVRHKMSLEASEQHFFKF